MSRENKKAALLSIALHVFFFFLLVGVPSFFEKKKPIELAAIPVTFFHISAKPAPEPDLPPKTEEPKPKPETISEPETPPQQKKPVPPPKKPSLTKDAPLKKETPPKSKKVKKDKKKNLKKQKTLDDLLKAVSTKKSVKKTSTPQTKSHKKGAKASGMPANQKRLLAENLRQQFSHCWSTTQRVRDARDCKVTISLKLDESGRVVSAKILPHKSTTKHPDFKVAAESAMRAIYHPSCNPLILPEDYYEDWKETIISFSAHDM